MTDQPAPPANQGQIDYWNAEAGSAWVGRQRQLDRQLGPLGAAAMNALAPAPGERVLDVGCGSGDTSIALAARVTPGGSVLGVDISEPLLALARRRIGNPNDVAVSFERVDAQVGQFGREAFDGIFSRFGVMFFAEPAAAFANLRSALKPGGRLAFVCWRPLIENPLMAAPSAAIAHLLPPAPPSDPLAPGPFAFADLYRIRQILGEAGFQNVAVDAFDAEVNGGTLEEATETNLHVGPVSRVLREAPDLREPVAAAVREGLRAFLRPEGVVFPAAVWIVQASNP